MIERASKRTRWAQDRGAVLPLVAIVLPVLLIMTAFAVDLGRQRSLRRTMQARADIIAMDMVRLADGRTEDQILGSVNGANYTAYLEDTAVANHADHLIDQGGLLIEYGTWSDASGFIQTLGNGVPTAVKVTANDEMDYTFRPGTGKASRSAIARTDAVAGFSIGSFAASLNSTNSPLLNQLIGDALGLGVLSYDGLASSNLTFLGIASQMGLGTPSELFAGDVSAFDALDAAADILRQDSANAAQVAILDQVLGVPNSPLRDVRVGDVISVAAGGEDAALASNVNLLDLLASSAFIANGSSGVSLPVSQLNLPGTNITGNLNLIQAPQTVFGRVGASTGTSQAGVTAQLTLGTNTICDSITDLLGILGGLVSNLLGLLTGGQGCGLLNLDRLISVEITATINVNLATAQGTIARIGCGVPQELDIDVRSDLATANVNVAAVIKSGSNTIANLPLTASTGRNPANGTADFVLPPDLFDEFVPVNPGSGALGLSPTTFQLPSQLAPLLSPVLNALLNGNPNANPPVKGIVTRVEEQVLGPLSELMGVRVAGADVAPRAVACEAAQLVG